MNTRKKLAAQFDAPKNGTALPSGLPLSGTPSHAPAKVDSRRQEHPGFLGLQVTQETKETQDLKVVSKRPTQAAQTESYNAKKSPSPPKDELTQAPWKKALWTSLVDDIEAKLPSQALFFMLRDVAWLDRLEGKIAFVATESEFSRAMLARKVCKPLGSALSQRLNRPVRVQFIVGRHRLWEAERAGRAVAVLYDPVLKPEKTDEAAELAILHERYGDIMGIVDNYPVFKKASLPVNKGGWGIFPQLLTEACKDYGVIPILNGLRFIANRPSIVNPRGFFFYALKKGQFGHRLAVSVPTIGRLAQ